MSINNNNLTIEHLTVSYQGQKALVDISLQVPAGKITGIIGPNGAGKSTFLKGMLGLLKADSRTVFIGDQPLNTQKKRIAYVEQRSALDLSFPINVLEVVLLGTYPKLGIMKRPGKKEKEEALASLKTVQLEEFAKRQIGELSGGQLQRVFIARVLAQKADIIILDEPFVGIDMTSEKVIMDILKQLKEAGKTILIVHHDLHKVAHYFDDVIILKKKLIANGPVVTTFTNKNIQLAYGDTMGDIIIKGVADA
ncbi:ABC transporter ATP-binding protein [Enterococcus haemoperoxidus ATCC BAA-382]|uniref:ABC transporter ATP-binding protein n=1 Tax=Enterococcus haemoperoxidus ATCC BAA-382 TaxID=1158608 RepID=R2Q8H1_9ENTE|nr:metal ABC transporter ATP-binding protein [Enterococcus haemoperoxidus]EOH92792.1 ABC transporter ATP-binding protein [Enterococcus haemoperoxidus ATCC BAA-382]EOT61535.1 ABC transporter ATP-binding protein [Enterococcus haemoperoxidus ATCC BAA-382]OJG55368.1 ABC transporter ATP-binding protein [Enterococcus haemoperoxidus]